MKVIADHYGKPILSWCDNPEEGAIAQARNLASMPFLVSHVALMPDVHQGFGMPIGGVIGCDGVVIPAAVGVDIGCGMCAVETSLDSITVESLKNVIGKIRDMVPVGFQHQKLPQEGMPRHLGNEVVVMSEYENAKHQLGTLGGGNHFLEIQRSPDHVWAMIHSGSRNIGLKVAKHYDDIAKGLNEKWHASVPREHGLAFLPLDSAEGKAYVEEMDFCLKFAQANRDMMMLRIMSILHDETGCDFQTPINIHHNYATMEAHFGRNVMVHRKGATSARSGQIGIIPGSQGTSSYIVRGKGNLESLTSCSHGAGRRMGRKEACRSLDLAAERKSLDDRGILHAIRGKDDLDEAPGAYKDIDVVMSEQSDLVDIVVKLEPMAVIKG